MLNRLIDYARRANLAPEPGFAARDVHWALEISPRGEPQALIPLVSEEGRRKVPRTLQSAPEMANSLLRTGERCHFLLESVAVVLNLPNKEEEAEKIARKHQFFAKMIEEAASHVNELEPVAQFFHNAHHMEHARLMFESQKGRKTQYLTFSLNGQLLVEREACKSWWRQYFNRLTRQMEETPSAIDMVTGAPCVPEKTHARVRGLASAGGLATASLISFDKAAFGSYGLEQGANAPLSAETARAYVDALNQLISRQSVQLGDALVLHWYDGQVQQDEDPFAFLCDPAEADEWDALKRCRELLKSLQSGTKADLGRYRYYAMAVSGSGARVMVRFWMEGELKELAEKTERWFEATSIIDSKGRIRSGFPLSRLADTAVSARQERDPKSPSVRRVAIPLLSAALREGLIPHAIAVAIHERIRAEVASLEKQREEDTSHRPERMALLKAFFNRILAQKGESEASMVKPSIDQASPHPAYHCGRLMATLAEVQRRALGDVGAGVVQRYYAAASATPALVFGRLIRGAQYHLEKLSPRTARFFDEILGDITADIGSSMPSVLELEGQTLFALGYYHQLIHMRTSGKEPAAKRAEESISAITSNGEENNA